MKNAILSKRSLILDSQFKFIGSPIFDYWHNWQKTHGKQGPVISIQEMIKNARLRPTIELPDLPYVLGTTYGNHHNFSHLWDTIQSLKFVDGGILIHNQSHEKVNEFSEHLSIFGYPPDKRLSVNLDEFNYLIPNLIVPPLACKPNHFKFHEWMANKYHQRFPDERPHCSLYLSRRGFSRQLLNDSEISECLEKIGFVTLNGSEPLRAHVELFRSATRIVGYHGSLFKNILFCQQRPTILEFCPSNREDRCFLQQAQDCDTTENYQFKLLYADHEHNAVLDVGNLLELLLN